MNLFLPRHKLAKTVRLCSTRFPITIVNFDDMATSCMRPTPLDCSVNIANFSLPIDANPDVSGIGV